MVWSHFREVNFNFRIMDRMLGILKVKMSLEYPTFETAFESGLQLLLHGCGLVTPLAW